MKTVFRTSVASLLLAFAVAVCPLQAQEIADDWHGTLHAGAADLRLVLHLTKAQDGSLHGTLDSVDQAANGIPVTSVSLQDSQLKLVLDAIHGTYQGKVNPAATSISGTWTQGQPLPLTFERGAFQKPAASANAKPSDIDGVWSGTLDTPNGKLRVVFHIVNTEGGLTATFDSPDQGAYGLPVTRVDRHGSSLELTSKGIGAVYKGKIAGDLKTITGSFAQGGLTLPLVLTRVKDAAEVKRRRPQDPIEPYPYRVEEVAYENKTQPVRLAATLTIPGDRPPFRAVLLVTGSGPQNRDEGVMGHRPFLVLADYLTRHGIEVLRADDRGAGKSSGDFHSATTADFATDAEASIAYLRTRPEVDSRKIGIIGHSEGAMVASLVAARNPDVAFVVMMAGPGVPGDQVIPAQVAAILESNGKSHREAMKRAADERTVLLLSEHESDNAALERKLREVSAGKIPEAQLAAQIRQMRSPWFRHFLTYDPAVALRRVRCPVLAIAGEKDRQVLAGQNLLAIGKALETAGNEHVEIEEMPGLNHLFQTAKTGSPAEYAQIDETIAPMALKKIATWILRN